LLCFSRHLAAEHSPTGQADTVVVVINLDPHATREGTISLDLAALGLPAHEPAGDVLFAAHDDLSGFTYAWGGTPFVSLDPRVQCAHVIHVRNP
jgi:starch synthase (maltosyl-transferring)